MREHFRIGNQFLLTSLRSADTFLKYIAHLRYRMCIGGNCYMTIYGETVYKFVHVMLQPTIDAISIGKMRIYTTHLVVIYFYGTLAHNSIS